VDEKIIRMKITLLSYSILLSFISAGQNIYRIGNVFWEYDKPASYKTRIDNFSSSISAGDSAITKNNNLQKQSADDIILFSFAKQDSSDMNAVLASYQSNSNILKFGLKGYIDKLEEFIIYNYEQLKTDAHINRKETVINNMKFYIIESRVYNKDKDFTYWTKIYIAEISGKELNITITYDNENNRKLIEASIMSSKFHN
jgi:hypothetical protein